MTGTGSPQSLQSQLKVDKKERGVKKLMLYKIRIKQIRIDNNENNRKESQCRVLVKALQSVAFLEELKVFPLLVFY